MPALLENLKRKLRANGEQRWLESHKISPEGLDFDSTEILPRTPKRPDQSSSAQLATKLILAMIVVAAAGSNLFMSPVSTPKEIASAPEHSSKTDVGQESKTSGSTETKTTVEGSTRPNTSSDPAPGLSRSPNPAPAPRSATAPQGSNAPTFDPAPLVSPITGDPVISLPEVKTPAPKKEQFDQTDSTPGGSSQTDKKVPDSQYGSEAPRDGNQSNNSGSTDVSPVTDPVGVFQ